MIETNVWNTWIQIPGLIWNIETKRTLWSFRPIQFHWLAECPAVLSGNDTVNVQVLVVFLNFCAFHYHKWRLQYAADELYIDYVFVAKE